MVEQLQLFAKSERFDAWKDFHAKNPYVFTKFQEFANTAQQEGCTKLGARFLGERIRWHVWFETVGGNGFKINDHFWPYYARLLVAIDPSFDGFFTFKDARFDTTRHSILNFHRSLPESPEDA